MDNLKNFTIDTDAYKIAHHLMYPSDMVRIYSYAESRVKSKFPSVVFFGLQAILLEHFTGPVITKEKIEQGREESFLTFGTDKYFNNEMWNHILNKYGGHLPLTISAVPEGTVVPVDNVLFDITSKDDKCKALVGHSETLLMHMWYPVTVATQSYFIKQAIKPLVEATGTPELLDIMVHDFGFRGVKNFEAAGLGGAANLLSFDGTDTMIASRVLKHFYGERKGISVWATEHSVATSFGEGQGEIDYVLHQLEHAPDDAIISLVCDSYDTFNFGSTVLADADVLEKIITREGRTVIRPDSGDPRQVVTRLLNILGETFGYTYNAKGYKVLQHNVGVLQGDGMDRESIPELYKAIINEGWSTDNLIVGSGGGLLEKMDRDTQRFAIKASHGVNADGSEFEIFKNPKTMASKKSKKGYLKLHPSGSTGYTTWSSADLTPAQFKGYVDAKEKVFEDGTLVRRYTLKEVLENLERFQ